MRFREVMREIHSRRVWQVLAIYSGIALVLIRLIDFLLAFFHLPLWFGPGAFVAILLGFPVLLTTAWIQGGSRGEETFSFGFQDTANGGDDSLSSWRSLEREPLRDALHFVFTWRNAIAGGVLMALLLGIGAFI